MTTLRRAVKKNRGVAVLLALFFMILLAMIGVALIGLVPVELRSATRTKLDLQAHYTVTTGIRHARAWCSAVMTPTSSVNGTTPEDLGDNPATVGNNFYNAGGSYYNEITGVNTTAASVEYLPIRYSDIYASNYIPTTNAKWGDAASPVAAMLNIPASGNGAVDGNTVCLIKKQPITLGNWSAYVVIIPDADTPGGKNTQTAGKITTSFGGAGKSGRRCYQIISIAYYQGFPTLRGKTTVLEDSFARYSLFIDEDPTGSWVLQALPNQQTTLGPVHTNGTFKFGINPGVWSQSSTAPVPFNGLLTFAKYADASSGVVSSLNHDGAVYSQGNDLNGTSTNYRPFDNSGNDPASRYNKMVAGGRSNLRQTSNVQLPPDSAKLANAAFGQDFNTGLYTNGAVSNHLKQGGQPDGIFVFPNTSSGTAAGGVVIKGDQPLMFLEVVGTNGLPITNTASLESGNAVGNPAIRVQGKQTSGYVTSTFSGQTTSNYNTTSTLFSTVFPTSTPTLASSSTGTTKIPIPVPLTSTSWKSTSSLSYHTSISTSWSTFVTTTGWSTYSTGTSLTTVGQAGGQVQTITLYTTSPRTKTTSTSSTTRLTTSTQTIPTSTPTVVTTGTSTSTQTQILYGTSTGYNTFNTTQVSTTVKPTSSVYNTSFVTSSSRVFKPIDQMIEAKTGFSLNITNFSGANTDLYKQPAGAHTGSGNPQQMDVSKLSGITELLMVGSGGTTTPFTSTSIPANNVVVIKQSRTDPSKALVFVVPATPNTDGDLLNGAVYSEGSIGSPGDPTATNYTHSSSQRAEGGLAGVNMGRKTIGTQIQSGTATNDSDPFAKQFAKPSTSLGIVNNVFQYGTPRRENNPDNLSALNGLGLVSEDIRINADPDQFTNFWSGNTPNYNNDNFLNIHAVMLAGSQAKGGLTVRGFQDIDRITPGFLNAATARTPLIRFVGGTILRNYYSRINAVTQAGWMSKNLYNQQLALKPPPYFPNNGLLLPLSYIEERIWSEQK